MRMIQQTSINEASDGQHRLFVRVVGESREALAELQRRIEAWADEFYDGDDEREGTD